ncbi:hypothetical protein PIB30_027908 [Stylosanthes scabra]|uniref:Uncharacterized protein n=1 Tax=Stylosanthes scabra TaxID=79078 RepID=A0ABU6Z7R8_9FABA|nr:hypothetical protein [Stylosanthes scabra]
MVTTISGGTCEYRGGMADSWHVAWEPVERAVARGAQVTESERVGVAGSVEISELFEFYGEEEAAARVERVSREVRTVKEKKG